MGVTERYYQSTHESLPSALITASMP